MCTKLQWGLWHVGLALVIGVVVFVTSVLASWIHMREPGVGSMRQRSTQMRLGSLAGDLREYHDEQGEWPATLCEANEFYCEEGPRQADQWGHPYLYSVENGDVALYSLGRDGRPGGIGLDADLYSDRRNDEAARLPLDQFLYDTPTRGNRGPCMMIALIAVVQYLSLQIYERPAPSAGRRQGILLALGVIVGATIVAFLVTPAHIPSGH